MLTFDFFNSRLRYEPKTGSLYWKLKPGNDHETNRWNSKHANKIAGNINRTGKPYVRVCLKINGKPKLYAAHRLAWLIHHGKLSDEVQIDHINGIKHDNRIDNLRLATNSQNQFNLGLRSDNVSGYRGVHFSESRNRYRTAITVNGETRWLKDCNTAEEAGEVFRREAEKLHGEYFKET